MGEYFICANPDMNEFVRPSDYGSGLKRKEILGTGAAALDAMAILLSDPGTGKRRPADMHCPQKSGRWSEGRCIFVGDGAWQNGISPWPWKTPEAEMYDDMTSGGRNVGKGIADRIAVAHGMTRVQRLVHVGMLDGKKETFGINMMIPLELTGGTLAVADKEIPGFEGELADANKKIEDKSPAGYILDARDGTRRLVANLDRKEYLDPRQMSEHPTLLGMMRGHAMRYSAKRDDQWVRYPSTLEILGRMIFPEHGEIDSINGRWRGDRLIITAESSNAHPTTLGIEHDPGWRDMTQRLIAMLPPVDWKLKDLWMDGQTYGRIRP